MSFLLEDVILAGNSMWTCKTWVLRQVKPLETGSKKKVCTGVAAGASLVSFNFSNVGRAAQGTLTVGGQDLNIVYDRDSEPTHGRVGPDGDNCLNSEVKTIRVRIRDNLNGSAAALRNVVLNGMALSDISFTSDGVSIPNNSWFCISSPFGDFGDFVITGDLEITKWQGNERMLLEVNAICGV